jgi:hypothetical protein
MLDTSCLYSTVKNVSGTRRIFGFLPPHGRELANNEEFTVFGDIRQSIGGSRGAEPSVQRRDRTAFANAIANGWLVIVKTPSPIFKDATTGAIKMLRTNNGALAVVDPCWANTL